ncbi:hypothetical protein VPNG_01901 [Cytospora leucostoma]|uniref:RRM domain-containing protein n=1 Tax=Cytospora leucostoma TaxID=1230097 RepID=A0A423XIV8_9PEZI|nr:hypothetical protein VPNG_01901 [Cytospora leucostoma]
MSTKPPSRVVFVGNIPYGLSEEQISELFSSAGQVLNFRLVYDRETGRPKGFGFAEYPDADSASSAVRNLNDHEIMGRKLRVDFSNEGGAGGNDDSGNRNNDRSNDRNDNYNPPPTNGANDAASAGGPLPPLPPGRELPAGVTCTDAISRTLNTLPPAQLLDILGSMKQLASTDPARATELLNQAPQLSYAIFQALLLMGLVGPEAINSVLEPGSVPAPPPAMPGGYPPAPVGFPGGAANTPPVVAPAPYAPPPAAVPTPVVAAAAPVAAPAPAAAFGGVPGQNPDELIQQVLSLPEEVIAQLPEAEKAAILQLRAQYGGQRV